MAADAISFVPEGIPASDDEVTAAYTAPEASPHPEGDSLGQVSWLAHQRHARLPGKSQWRVGHASSHTVAGAAADLACGPYRIPFCPACSRRREPEARAILIKQGKASSIRMRRLPRAIATEAGESRQYKAVMWKCDIDVAYAQTDGGRPMHIALRTRLACGVLTSRRQCGAMNSEG